MNFTLFGKLCAILQSDFDENQVAGELEIMMGV
jgi:hypothetical protein